MTTATFRAPAGSSLPAASSLCALHQLLGVLVSSLSTPDAKVSAVLSICELDSGSLATLEQMVGALVNDATNAASSIATGDSTLSADNGLPAPALPNMDNSLPPALPNMPFRSGPPWVVGALYSVVPAAPLSPASEAGLSSDTRWYAVFKGHSVGVTVLNELALEAVSGVTDNRMKSFSTQATALAEFNAILYLGRVAVVH
ncbi:hypothetical protein C8F01DRAFT_1136372 [Mycena amicta]|nr:hypothetical protein C8F01DRAFT_1136372 [Mycena amicta]